MAKKRGQLSLIFKGSTIAQGPRREAGSKGSVEQMHGPMGKKQIRGILCWTSEHGFAESLSIRSAGCKSGGRALKPVELTSGDLSSVLAARLRVE